MLFKQYNVPTRLTLSRLVIAPLILPLLLVYFLPCNIFWINILLAAIFLMFGLTDFFDGYLARKYHQETNMGKLLDPIADKFLIYSTLIALLATGKIYFFWVIIFIGREFFVMGVRQIALEHKFSVPVSFGAKIKTALQIILLAELIINPYQSCALGWWKIFEQSLIFVTLLLSLISAARYYESFMIHFRAFYSSDRPSNQEGS